MPITERLYYIVNKYEGDKYVKHFTCKCQLLTLIFGQFSSRESLRDLVVALDFHHSKCYHVRMGKNVSKSSLSKANQDRDYHIFEEFVYYFINEIRLKRVNRIFKLEENIYAFDLTTIDLCLSVFWWTKFRKKKDGIRVHTLYDVETQIPAFFHITHASIYDSKVMKDILYESGSYYMFYQIYLIRAYFVVRSKKNMQCKTIKWKRRLHL